MLQGVSGRDVFTFGSDRSGVSSRGRLLAFLPGGALVVLHRNVSFRYLRYEATVRDGGFFGCKQLSGLEKAIFVRV